MAGLRKNVASQNLTFQINSATTGAGITASVSGNVVIDGGSQSAAAGTLTHKGGGQWNYAPTQAETNGTSIGFQFTATGAVSVNLQFFTDNYDTTQPVVTSGTGTDQLSLSAGKVVLQATQTGVTIPTVTTVTNQLTAAAIATGIWQDATAGDFTTAGSIGKSLFTSGNAPGAASGLALVGSNMGSVTSISGVSFPANFSSLAITAGGATTVGTNNDKSGYSLSQAFPANFSLLAIDGSGDVTYNNAAPPSSATIATAVLTTAMSESYSTKGSPFDLRQGIYDIHQFLFEFNINSTTYTTKKRDQSTTAKTGTLNDATSPTGQTEAS